MIPDPDRPAVPGLERADGRTGPLDRAQDPDRFVPEDHPRLVEPAPRVLGAPDDPDRYDFDRDDPDRDDPDRDDPAGPPELPRGLDPAYDPDRYVPPGQGQTLTDLLGKGSQEGERDGYQWVVGLLGVFLFLALVAFLFGSVLTP